MRPRDWRVVRRHLFSVKSILLKGIRLRLCCIWCQGVNRESLEELLLHWKEIWGLSIASPGMAGLKFLYFCICYTCTQVFTVILKKPGRF